MLDDDDVGAFAFIFSPTKPVGLMLWLIAIAGLCAWAASNRAECAAQGCPPGLESRLMDGECFCVVRKP